MMIFRRECKKYTITSTNCLYFLNLKIEEKAALYIKKNLTERFSPPLRNTGNNGDDRLSFAKTNQLGQCFAFGSFLLAKRVV
tara:strand:- start:254 stop:499 length:246 start_codon:yes stop_codon:yes gene_type:complete